MNARLTHSHSVVFHRSCDWATATVCTAVHRRARADDERGAHVRQAH